MTRQDAGSRSADAAKQRNDGQVASKQRNREPSGPRPAVSIVIPVYDGAATIGRALDSVLAQSFTDFEVVVVDDASRDDLAGALARFRDRRVRVLRHERNRGAAAARNTGIAEAQGELIAFLDADDEWLPEKLARQTAYLDTLPDDALICCTAFSLRRDNGAADEVHVPAFQPDQPALPKIAFGCDLSPGSTLLARRRSFQDIGGFDESLHRLEDWDWLLRYAARYRVGVVPEPLARIYPGGPRDAGRTLAALEALQRKWLGTPGSAIGQYTQRIRSSICIEKAAVFYNGGQILRPIAYVALSFLHYPLRNWSFFTRMGSHLLRAFRRR
jgi:glycosyltransferase involved in cell wall biosynthesis